MSNSIPQRIAFVVNALAGNELKAGKRDVAKIYSILTDQLDCRYKFSKAHNQDAFSIQARGFPAAKGFRDFSRPGKTNSKDCGHCRC